MKKCSLLLLLLFCFVAMGKEWQCEPRDYPSFTNPKQRETTLKTNPSLVLVRGSCSGGCSGSLIAGDLVLTSAHCVDNIPVASIIFSDDKMAVGQVVAKGDWDGSISEDWAIIKTAKQSRPFLRLTCSMHFPEEGKDITQGGRLWPMQQEYATTYLGIFAEGTFPHFTPFLLFKGRVDHGDSGSPLVDERGDIVGVVSELDPANIEIGKATALMELHKAVDPFVPANCPLNYNKK